MLESISREHRWQHDAFVKERRKIVQAVLYLKENITSTLRDTVKYIVAWHHDSVVAWQRRCVTHYLWHHDSMWLPHNLTVWAVSQMDNYATWVRPQERDEGGEGVKNGGWGSKGGKERSMQLWDSLWSFWWNTTTESRSRTKNWSEGDTNPCHFRQAQCQSHRVHR